MKSTQCDQVRARLPLFRDRLLDSVQTRRMALHLASCDECASLFGALLATALDERGPAVLVGESETPLHACYAIETLDAYCRRELSEEESELVRTHLDTCHICSSSVTAAVLSGQTGRRFLLPLSEIWVRLSLPTKTATGFVALASLIGVLLFIFPSARLNDTSFPPIEYPQSFIMKGEAVDKVENEIVELWRQKRWRDAEALLQQQERRQPELASSFELFIGVCLIRQNRPREAVERLLPAAARTSGNAFIAARLFIALAEAYTDLENCREARQALRQAKTVEPRLTLEIAPIEQALSQKGCLD